MKTPSLFSYTFSPTLVFLKEKALFQYNKEEIENKYSTFQALPWVPAFGPVPRYTPLMAMGRSLGKYATSCAGQHLYSTFKYLVPSAKQTHIGCLLLGMLVNPSISQRSKASFNLRINVDPCIHIFYEKGSKQLPAQSQAWVQLSW